MRTFIILALSIVMLIGTLGCSDNNSHPQASISPNISSISPVTVTTPKQSLTSPIVSNAPSYTPPNIQLKETPIASITSPAPSPVKDDLSQQVDGNNSLAIDLYHQLAQQKGNLVFSSYGISYCLAMAYGGAKGDTAKQMANTLHFVLTDDLLHPTFTSLNKSLTDSGGKLKAPFGGRLVDPYQLSIINGIWGQKNYPFLSSYLDLLKTNYGCGLQQVDFANSSEEVRLQINKWISDQTGEKIKELIAPRDIDSLTRLILANAIFFKANWMFPFREDDTKNGPFYLVDNTTIDVPIMHCSYPFSFSSGTGYQALTVPYIGNKIEMVFLLPEKGNFAAFERKLDKNMLDTIIQNMKRSPDVTFSSPEIALYLPKFSFGSEFKLKSSLSELGMTKAFADADFSGMANNEPLFIKDVIHKTTISADEQGTEVSSATAAIVLAGISESRFIADHPFIFLIRDNQTGTILFLGRVLNPNE